MRSSRSALAVLAAASVVVVLSVAPPANAAPLEPAPGPLPAPDTSWAPPADADDAPVPEDLNVPEDPWEPSPDVRLDQPADANSRGIAPLGAPVGTVAGAPGTGELPWFSFQDFPLAPDTSAQVNIANGNLLVKANDLTVPVPGYGLRQDRFYNGLSTRPGTLGGGWQTNNGAGDLGLDNQATYADFYGPNGLKLRFTRVGSSSSFTRRRGRT